MTQVSAPNDDKNVLADAAVEAWIPDPSCASLYSALGHPSAEGLLRATYGKGRYQLLVLLVLGGLYVVTFPIVNIQPFVTARIVNDDAYPTFTQSSVNNCQTLLFVGWSISFLVVSPLMDKIGRKTVWIVTSVCTLSVIGNAFAPDTGSLVFYSVTLFFMGTGCLSCTLSYIFLCECVPGSWRPMVTVVGNVLYSVGLGICAFCCGSVTNEWDWRAEYLFWFVPIPILGVFGAFLIHEPLYFLIANQRWESAEKTVAAIARVNGVACPLITWPSVGNSTIVSEHEPKPNPLRAISSWPMIRRTAASSVTWLATSLGFYGLSYSAGNLSNSMYTNTELFALADIAGNFVPILLIPLFGRRGTQLGAYIGAAVLLVACGFIPQGSPLLVACSVCARLLLDISFTTVYILSVECFPTSCRTTALGISNFIARMLGLAAPLLGGLPVSVSCPVFASLCLLAAGATLCLPITGDGSLDDEHDEHENTRTGLLQSELGGAAL